ncbi:MAG TPA: sulfate ABC transporter permease subunit [Solirubrobacterales bacterium]
MTANAASLGQGRASKWGLRTVALVYLGLLLILPVIGIFFEAISYGIGTAIDAVTTPEAQHAFFLTIVMCLIAVPLNTIFGVLTALVLVRQKFRGKAFLNALIDLPFAISPVVIGLALLLLYGPRDSWLGEWFFENGIQIIFSPIGMAIATTFVSLPFVVREVEPVLREIGTDQEQAASTLGASGWQTFWRITLPAIRWGVTYGVVLATARALGEFGAVSVVSSNVAGETETVPLFVARQYELLGDHVAGAYSASIVLAILALLTLASMNLIRRRDKVAATPTTIAIAPQVTEPTDEEDPR